MYDSLFVEVKRYSEDIHTIYGYGVYVESVSGGTSEEIKSLILAYQNNLCGVLFVGKIAESLFEVTNDHGEGGYQRWPCDLFYTDLDGLWTDTDQNGILDSHVGNVAPDIMLGRISTTGMPSLDSTSAFRELFNRDHKFWWDSSFQSEMKSLAYTNPPWSYNASEFNSTQFNLLSGETNTDSFRYGFYTDFSSSDYLSKVSSGLYRFTQLASHSCPQSHSFYNNETIGVQDVIQSQSSNIAYNLYCCSACNWMLPNNYGYMGGAYLFGGSKTLAVLGSTKVGSMLGFNKFYSPLRRGKSIGESLKEWWIAQCGSTHSLNEIHWFYGMTLLGDPNINFRYSVSNYCVDNLSLSVFPQNDTSNLIMNKAANSIALSGNYVIPQGVHVIEDAPQIVIHGSFKCPVGASFETRNEGCNIDTLD